nr:PaaX family transcriptional regulator C-terminal domain-containing protein [Kineosporia rhizophila]
MPARFVVESLVDDEGTASLAQVYDVGNALGIPDQPMRLTVRRMIAAGEFVQEGRGRAGTLRRTATADLTERHDAAFVEFATRRDQGQEPWDGWWHLFVYSVPETDRQLRDDVRRTLVRLGGAQLRPGVYVSADPWQALVNAELGDAEVNSWTLSTQDLRRGELREPAELAAALWPLPEISGRYTALPRLTSSPVGSDRIENLRRALELVAAFDQAMAPDPLLPPELLPSPWPPVAARAAFHRAWADLAEAVAAEGLPLFRRFAAGNSPAG